ncbi:unnamed protein product [Jaminaea pallidilutea]
MANNPNMDALLKWSMRNQDPNAPPASEIAEQLAQGKRPDLDPSVLDAMMGKSEAQMMQEELAVAVNEKRSDDDRATALDNFEMLIESIDNANLITSMKMWQPLLALLSSTSSPQLQVATLWILGTAVQNNPSAQDALLHAPTANGQGLDAILPLLRDSSDMGVRAKAMYTVSGLLGHYPKAVQEFESKGGFVALKGALQDPSINIRRKTAFLINSLLMQDDSAAQSAAAQPLLLGGPPASATSAAAAPAPAPTTTPATAVAPLPNSGPTSASPAGPAPYEKPPVTSTEASGVRHPSITTAMLRSGLFKMLLASLLPSSAIPAGFSSGGGNDDDAANRPPELGPDGDAPEAREDEDYAEKALRAATTFVSKYDEAPVGARVPLEAGVVKGIQALRSEYDGKTAAAATWDWKRLNLDAEEWQKFEAGVDRLAA